MVPFRSLVLAGLLALFPLVLRAQQDLLAYAGGNGPERFNTVLQLSDGTYLVGGSANDLNWVRNGGGGPGIPRTEISSGSIRNDRSTRQKIGFILHLSADLRTILRVFHFRRGDVEDVRHLKTNSLPGAPTGDIFLSGTIEYQARPAAGGAPARVGGYYLAKLNNNFVSGIPNGMTWSTNVWATGLHKTRQPWDVGADGKIVYVTGQPFDTDWCAVHRLRADGTGNEIVDNWNTHRGADILTGSPVLGEWTPAYSNPQVRPSESLVDFKLGRCSLRSWAATPYTEVYPDENATTKRGRWPLDYYFASPCNPLFPGATQNMPGYTGYQAGANPTGYVGGIAVDKQTNDIYLGASFQSVTSSGQPDFEPFLIGYSAGGAKKWWVRLYQETPDQSPPDQYIDALTIDYAGAQKSVVVMGRQHGNARNSFWAGNAIQNNPLLPFGTPTFTQQFTGTNGDMHLSWLGKYRAASGDLLYSTYVAGFFGSGTGIDAASVGSVPEALDFPNHNRGFPDLSDTRAEVDLKVDASGRIYALLRTRGFTTTNNAYQRQESPVPNLLSSNRRDTGGDYVVVYEPDLRSLVYSSLLTGEWNRTETDASRGSVGGGNTKLLGVMPSAGGVTLVGFHQDLNADAIPDGTPIPFYFQHRRAGSPPNTASPAFVPQWGSNTYAANDGETAILARLTFAKRVRADFRATPDGGACTNVDVPFNDLSFADAGLQSWAWDFGAGATPANTSAQNPTVRWTTPGIKTVSLTVRGNDGSTDTRTVRYFVADAPGAAFTFTGTPGPAPATLTFDGPTGAGLTYEWQITDPTTGVVTTYATRNPSHVFANGGTPGTAYPVRLTVIRGACTQTSTQTITINGGPGPILADFTANGSPTPPSVCAGETVTFKQINATNATTWQWVFGEGAVPMSASTAGPHEIAYNGPGPKRVTLTVGNGTNNVTYEMIIGVAAPPSASFGYVVNTPNAAAQANFTADDNTQQGYEWNFGNRVNPSTATGSTVNNVNFPVTGEYAVGLTVTSANGCKTTYYRTVSIGAAPEWNPAFQASFFFGPAGGACVNNKVSIREVATGGQSTSASNFSWDFGRDAQPASSSSYKPPLVSWSTPGQKVVTLTINDNGNTRVRSQVYEVYPYPTADFAVDATNSACAAAPYKVAFNPALGTGNLYQWNFGPTATPATSISSSPVVNFAADGTVPVQLTVSRNGCQSIVVKNLQLAAGTCGVPTLAAGISLRPSRAGCASQQYTVQSASVGNITPAGYAWTFPNNAAVSRSGAGPKTLTLVSGEVVTLQVTDQGGRTDTVTLRVP